MKNNNKNKYKNTILVDSLQTLKFVIATGAIIMAESCSSLVNVNKLNTDVLFSNNDALTIDLLQTYNIDSTKNYSNEYIKDMIAHNEKILLCLDSLYDNLMNQQEKILSEMESASKAEKELLRKKNEQIKNSKPKIKAKRASVKKANMPLEGLLNTQKKSG